MAYAWNTMAQVECWHSEKKVYTSMNDVLVIEYIFIE